MCFCCELFKSNDSKPASLQSNIFNVVFSCKLSNSFMHPRMLNLLLIVSSIKEQFCDRASAIQQTTS